MKPTVRTLSHQLITPTYKDYLEEYLFRFVDGRLGLTSQSNDLSKAVLHEVRDPILVLLQVTWQ